MAAFTLKIYRIQIQLKLTFTQFCEVKVKSLRFVTVIPHLEYIMLARQV
ncbi:hypothetical protein IMSAGC006_01142 [Muribaculaceae bacterium]|nr:hypothetical protein IMSAGC006_01142 [Muribaculaceae bacterium]